MVVDQGGQHLPTRLVAHEAAVGSAPAEPCEALAVGSSRRPASLAASLALPVTTLPLSAAAGSGATRVADTTSTHRMPFGAEWRNDRVRFRLWAPSHPTVHVRFGKPPETVA